jgi:hypothetical protein
MYDCDTTLCGPRASTLLVLILGISKGTSAVAQRLETEQLRRSLNLIVSALVLIG